MTSLFLSLTFQLAHAANALEKCGLPTARGREPIEACATVTGDEIKLEASAFKKIVFGRDGLADISIGADCYWINKKQIIRRTYCFDNGADYFSEGLARFVDAKGLFGYINKKLKIVISPKYDFVYPYEKGRARVCSGCKASAEPGREYSTFKGGTWEVIDKKGRSVSK